MHRRSDKSFIQAKHDSSDQYGLTVFFIRRAAHSQGHVLDQVKFRAPSPGLSSSVRPKSVIGRGKSAVCRTRNHTSARNLIGPRGGPKSFTAPGLKRRFAFFLFHQSGVQQAAADQTVAQALVDCAKRCRLGLKTRSGVARVASDGPHQCRVTLNAPIFAPRAFRCLRAVPPRIRPPPPSNKTFGRCQGLQQFPGASDGLTEIRHRSPARACELSLHPRTHFPTRVGLFPRSLSTLPAPKAPATCLRGRRRRHQKNPLQAAASFTGVPSTPIDTCAAALTFVGGAEAPCFIAPQQPPRRDKPSITGSSTPQPRQHPERHFAQHAPMSVGPAHSTNQIIAVTFSFTRPPFFDRRALPNSTKPHPPIQTVPARTHLNTPGPRPRMPATTRQCGGVAAVPKDRAVIHRSNGRRWFSAAKAASISAKGRACFGDHRKRTGLRYSSIPDSPATLQNLAATRRANGPRSTAAHHARGQSCLESAIGQFGPVEWVQALRRPLHCSSNYSGGWGQAAPTRYSASHCHSATDFVTLSGANTLAGFSKPRGVKTHPLHPKLHFPIHSIRIARTSNRASSIPTPCSPVQATADINTTGRQDIAPRVFHTAPDHRACGIITSSNGWQYFAVALHGTPLPTRNP